MERIVIYLVAVIWLQPARNDLKNVMHKVRVIQKLLLMWESGPLFTS